MDAARRSCLCRSSAGRLRARGEGRGAGVELRLYDCDPDAAEAAARAVGHVVLAGAADKPHGLREAFILDPDGYCWVPGRAIGP